jgi:hypothetical protein
MLCEFNICWSDSTHMFRVEQVTSSIRCGPGQNLAFLRPPSTPPTPGEYHMACIDFLSVLRAHASAFTEAFYCIAYGSTVVNAMV